MLVSVDGTQDHPSSTDIVTLVSKAWVRQPVDDSTICGACAVHTLYNVMLRSSTCSTGRITLVTTQPASHIQQHILVYLPKAEAQAVKSETYVGIPLNGRVRKALAALFALETYTKTKIVNFDF